MENDQGHPINPPSDYRVHICFGPNCTPRGSRALLEVFQRAVNDAGIADRVELIATSCRNRCEFGPSVNVYPGPSFYCLMDEQSVIELVHQHLVGGQPVKDKLAKPHMWRREGG